EGLPFPNSGTVCNFPDSADGGNEPKLQREKTA
ncbi:hypothetical protein NPIL_69571, partial [Nephila pilipes]